MHLLAATLASALLAPAQAEHAADAAGAVQGAARLVLDEGAHGRHHIAGAQLVRLLPPFNEMLLEHEVNVPVFNGLRIHTDGERT